jgi:DNA-binding IclR family transcriptional regulator
MSKSSSDRDGNIVRSVDRAIDLLEELMSEKVSLSLSELSDRTKLPPSTAYRILATMEKRRFVYQDSESKLYTIGPKLMYPTQSGQSSQALINFVTPILQEVSHTTGESASMTIRSGNHAMCIAKAMSGRSVDVSLQSGALAPLHCTAVGKSIMSNLDTIEIVKIVEEEGLKASTPNTITDLGKLLTALDEIRTQGYAIDNEEWEIGIRCVAVPVFSGDGKVFGAISVSGPAGRITPQITASLAEVITLGANKLSIKLGYNLETNTNITST